MSMIEDMILKELGKVDLNHNKISDVEELRPIVAQAKKAAAEVAAAIDFVALEAAASGMSKGCEALVEFVGVDIVKDGMLNLKDVLNVAEDPHVQSALGAIVINGANLSKAIDRPKFEVAVADLKVAAGQIKAFLEPPAAPKKK